MEEDDFTRYSEFSVNSSAAIMELPETAKVKLFVQAFSTIRTKLTVRKYAITTIGTGLPIDDIGGLYRRKFARMA